MRNEFSNIFPSRSLSYLKIVKGESFFSEKAVHLASPHAHTLAVFP